MTEISEDRWRLIFTEISCQCANLALSFESNPASQASARCNHCFKMGFTRLCTNYRNTGYVFVFSRVLRYVFSGLGGTICFDVTSVETIIEGHMREHRGYHHGRSHA